MRILFFLLFACQLDAGLLLGGLLQRSAATLSFLHHDLSSSNGLIFPFSVLPDGLPWQKSGDFSQFIGVIKAWKGIFIPRRVHSRVPCDESLLSDPLSARRVGGFTSSSHAERWIESLRHQWRAIVCFAMVGWDSCCGLYLTLLSGQSVEGDGYSFICRHH